MRKKINISDMLDNEKVEAEALTQININNVNIKKIKLLTLKKIKEKGNGDNMKPKRISIKILLIAAVIFAFAITAYSTAYFIWDEQLLNYFNPNQEQKEQLDVAGQNVDKSVTLNGLTFEIKQVIGDKYEVYVLCDITAPEEIILNNDYIFECIEFKINNLFSNINSFSGSYGHDIIDDGNPNDNKQTYIFRINSTDTGTDNGLNGKSATLSLHNLGYWKMNEGMVFEQVIEGVWEITWKIDYTDISKNIEVNKPTQIFDGASTLKSINISPLSVTSKIEGKSIKKYDDMCRANDLDRFKYDISDIISVILKDGTKLESAGIGSGNDKDKFTITFMFKNIVDIENIESVIIGDLTIPINE